MIDLEDALCQMRRLSHMPGYPKDGLVVEDYIQALIRHADHETHAAEAISSVQSEPGARCPGIGVLISILRSSSTAKSRVCERCHGDRWLDAGTHLVTTATDAQGHVVDSAEPITAEQTEALRAHLVIGRQMVYEAVQPCACRR